MVPLQSCLQEKIGRFHRNLAASYLNITAVPKSSGLGKGPAMTTFTIRELRYVEKLSTFGMRIAADVLPRVVLLTAPTANSKIANQEPEWCSHSRSGRDHCD